MGNFRKKPLEATLKNIENKTIKLYLMSIPPNSFGIAQSKGFVGNHLFVPKALTGTFSFRTQPSKNITPEPSSRQTYSVPVYRIIILLAIFVYDYDHYDMINLHIYWRSSFTVKRHTVL
jgi:hypothetical protein